MDRKGFELDEESLSKSPLPTHGGAVDRERLNNGDDADLARIVEAWPTLSPDVRSDIRGLIDVAGK